MLRVKLFQLKPVWATVLLSRIVKDTSKKKIGSVEYLNKARKSTDTVSKGEDYEKRMRKIEKYCPANTTDKDIKECKEYPKVLLNEKILPINFYDGNLDDKCASLISKVFGNEDSGGIKGDKHSRDTNFQATTAKIEEEKLTQKIERIDETPHVEAGVTKVGGFNVTPKVFGHDSYTQDVKPFSHDTFSQLREQDNLDELAKRCLGAPVGEIDKILLNELKNISHKNSQKLEVNFPMNGSAQKYFSQIFERKSKNDIVPNISNTHLEQVRSKEVRSVTENDSKLDRFQPFYLDTVPVLSMDEDCRDDTFKREYSSDIKNVLLDIPAVLDPYSMQAIPFYEYIRKEKVILQENPRLEPAAITKILQESKINTLINEEVIHKRNCLNEQDQVNNKEPEYVDPNSFTAKAVESLTASHDSTKTKRVSQISDSGISKLLEYKDVILPKQAVLEDLSSQHVLTSSTDESLNSQLNNTLENGSDTTTSAISNAHPYDDATKIMLSSTTDESTISDVSNTKGHEAEPKDSAISSTYPSEHANRTLELPINTAISANQSPNEYFEFSNDTIKSFIEVKNNQTQSVVDDTRVHDYEIPGAIVSRVGVAYDKTTNIRITDVNTTITDISDNRFNDVLVDTTGSANTQVTNNRVNGAIVNDTKVVDNLVYNIRVSPTNATDNRFINTKFSDTESTGNHGNTVVSDLNQPEYKVNDENVNSENSNNPVSESMTYSTMPPLLEVEEDTNTNTEFICNSEQPLVHRNSPITLVRSHPEAKRDEVPKIETNKEDTGTCLEDTIPLSILLRRIRERNRMELNRTVYLKSEAKPEEAKRNVCIPPLDKSKPKTNPNPCQPKPKELKPNPCKPQKKDPCAKFVALLLDIIMRSYTFDIVAKQKHKYASYMSTCISSLAVNKELAALKLKQLSEALNFLIIKHGADNKHIDKNDDILSARDFNPWVPIPSWPIPMAQKKRPLVCPNHGCSLPVRSIPSNTDKSCIGIPKKLSPTKSCQTHIFKTVYD